MSRLRGFVLRHRGISKRRPLLAALVIVLVVAVPGYAMLGQAIDDANAAAEKAETTSRALAAFVISQAETTCHERQDFREVLRSLVELSDDGTGLDLDAVPSFENLPETVKTYLRELEARSQQAPEPSRFVRDALELLDTVDCADPTLPEETAP